MFRVTLEWSMPIRDFSAPEYQTAAVQDYLNNECVLADGTKTCPGQTEGQTIFDFFDCVLDRNTTTSETVMDAFSLATPTKRESYEFPFAFYVLYLVIAFSVITSLFHLSLATCCYRFYTSELQQKRQPLRWLEYSITASIMMLIVQQLNSITDPFILLSSFFLVMSYNTLGAAMEYAPVKNWEVRVWFYMVSTLGFAMTFVSSFVYYYSAVSPWLELGGCSSWGDLFSFISLVVWSLFISYLTFPLLDTAKHAFLCCTERFKEDEALIVLDDPDDELTCFWRCCVDKHAKLRGIELHEARRVDVYKCSEIGYLILSFVSKTILVAIVGSASLGRGG